MKNFMRSFVRVIGRPKFGKDLDKIFSLGKL